MIHQRCTITRQPTPQYLSGGTFRTRRELCLRRSRRVLLSMPLSQSPSPTIEHLFHGVAGLSARLASLGSVLQQRGPTGNCPTAVDCVNFKSKKAPNMPGFTTHSSPSPHFSSNSAPGFANQKPPSKKRDWFKWVAVALSALFLLVVLASVIGNPETTTEADSSSATASPAATETSSADAPSIPQAPAPTRGAATPPSEAISFLDSQSYETPAELDESLPSSLGGGGSDNDVALRSAENYLEFMAFSKQGLYDQLIFEQHSPEAAQYAVDTIDADWNQQALKSARFYRESMAMSHGAIYDQLTSEAEGYTASEAQFAIDNL